MPTKPSTPCRAPGCTTAVKTPGYCQAHQHLQVRKPGRPTPGADYGHEWRKIRDAYKAEHPYCERPGCGKDADQVHHKIAQRDGGTHAWDNLEALCRHHHDVETAKERRQRERARRSAGRAGSKV